MHSILLNNGISHSRLHGFTLMEMLSSITIFFLIMTTILGVYRQMTSIRSDTTAKQHLIQESYLLMEKLNTMLTDKYIDYEEYFNRRLVGCNSSNLAGIWDTGTGGYCQRFTAYGNQHSLSSSLSDNLPTTNHLRYYCSSLLPVNQDLSTHSQVVFGAPSTVRDGLGCYADDPLNRFDTSMMQSYGQYHLQHWDVGLQTDAQKNTAALDDDDIQLGVGPYAIGSATGAQELYLISPDKQNRLYLRRRLVSSGDRDRDGIIGNSPTDRLYRIELLRLKGFDAGSQHSFDTISSGTYDGTIDTRACDSDEGFVCQGASIGGAYSGYRLPIDSNDGWLPLTARTISIDQRSLSLTPHRQPSYAWDINSSQINPLIRIQIKTHLYGEYRYRSIRPSALNTYSLTLQTAFTTKSQYTQ